MRAFDNHARRGPTDNHPDVGQGDGGFVLAMFALLLLPIIVFTALAVDVSSWYSRATELQRSADSAALAGTIWMPDLNQARTDATPLLRKNGFVDGVKNIGISMDGGSDGPTSFKVCITDNDVQQFFSIVFSSATKLTRCATAKFQTPLQLGSPLNYFGGSQQGLDTSIANPSNMATTTPDLVSFGSDRYCWVNEGSLTKGFWDRTSATQTNTTQWKYWPYPDNTVTGAHPVCTGTSAPAVPAQPSNDQSCHVPGTDPYQYWYNETHSGTFPTGWRLKIAQVAYSDCTYVTPTANPFPASKSPNFWPFVQSYVYGGGSDADRGGDAYSTQGFEYRSTGYWYSVDVPASGMQSGSLDIQAWDLATNLIGPDPATQSKAFSPMGDHGLGSLTGTSTRVRVFAAGSSKYDMSSIQPIAGCDTGWLTGISHPAYDMRWKVICSIGSPTAGARYYIQIQTSDDTGTGRQQSMSYGGNGYALRAVAGTYPSSCLLKGSPGNVACYGSGKQPQLSAYGDMSMFNGIPSGATTGFYLANVLPEYADKTMVIDLFDAGDAQGGNSWVTVMGPSSSSTNGSMVPGAACTAQSKPYGSVNWSPAPLSTTFNSGGCVVQTSTAGGPAPGSCKTAFDSRNFNSCWLRIQIKLPPNYGLSGTDNWTKCDPSVDDPVNTAGSCWWRIQYHVDGGQLLDGTTWSAKIIGDPVRLTH